MFRPEFAQLITSSGMVSLRDLKEIIKDKDPDRISEFDLLKIQEFDEIKFAQVMASKFLVPYLDISKAKIDFDVLNSFTRPQVAKYRAIPIFKKSNVIFVIIYDPSVTMSIADELSSTLKCKISFIITHLSAWGKLYDSMSKSAEDILGKIKEVKANDDATKDVKEEDIGNEVIDLVNRVLAEAYINKVSDIHIEPYEKNFRIRFRQDGSLTGFMNPPMGLMPAIISRLKIMAQMDIAEKRKPQDGRIKLMIASDPIDYRVSSLPTLFGEKIVLRLLDQSNLQLDMTKLGFEEKQLSDFKNAIYRPFGMCLVTGPTGSGKTTTLYSALSDLNQPDTNISTAEDPVEFNLEGINQVNVRKDIGLTFAAALKSFLRQDPDVIMVGEIRDYETGEIAVEAALTGHLVLSTLHTNDACATITRLLNMGIEPFLITGALNVVVAQRLCRKICQFCKEVDPSIGVDQLKSLGILEESAKKIKMYRGRGCEKCNNKGMKGRVAIYEVLVVTSKLKEHILKNAPAEELKKVAISEGMKTLRMSGLTKAAQGLTTLAEAVSNSGADN